MIEELKKYIDLLFMGTEDCDEIKEEILQNTIDRYQDLIRQGKSPQAAYRLAIAGIGDINEILGTTAASDQPKKEVTPKNHPQGKPVWKKVLKNVPVQIARTPKQKKSRQRDIVIRPLSRCRPVRQTAILPIPANPAEKPKRKPLLFFPTRTNTKVL